MFNKFKIIIIFLINTHSIHAYENQNSDAFKTDWRTNEIVTKSETTQKNWSNEEWEEYFKDSRNIIVWAGAGFPEYKSEISSLLIKDYEKDGLIKFLEDAKEGNTFCQGILGNYFLIHTKEFSKGVYWSQKAAENGSSYGMATLAHAYYKGFGVLPDLNEAVKWGILAACFGHYGFNKVFGPLLKDLPDDMQIGKSRADEWIKANMHNLYKAD